jgi:prepilin-type N-terminal cleavage/methylation domain-containing protein
MIYNYKSPPHSPLTKGGRRGGKLVLRVDHGFTLLELMISFAIIGIIIVIIIGAMRLGLRSVDSGEKRIEAIERFRTSLNIIDSQIQSEIPLTYVEDANTKYYFKGEREFLQFSTNYSIWGGEKGYVIVTYTVETGENGKQILYASENLVGLEAKRDTKLFDNFEKIYFEYFFRDPTEEEGKWVEQWTDDVSIPEKVRIHLVKGTRDLSMIIPMRTRGPLSQTPLSPTGF